MSLETVHDHPPRAYTTTRRQKRSVNRHPKDINQKSLTSFLTPYLNPLISSPSPHPTPPIPLDTSPSLDLQSPQQSSQLSIPTTQAFPHKTPPPSPFTIPRHPLKLNNQPPRSGSRKPSSPHSPNYHTNQFTYLEVFDPPTIEDFTLPHQHTTSLRTATTTTIQKVFDSENLLPHDVPQNGDCFYLAIQLFISQHYSPTVLTPIPFLRNAISNLLAYTPSGENILRDYNLTPHIITDVLPGLRPSLYPTRDTYAQDYVIAAMATLLDTNIEIFTCYDSHTPIKHTFTPYPNHIPPPFLPFPLPSISIWATGNHYQLLLNHSLSLPSLTQHLLPLPTIPLHNTNIHNDPITIETPPRSKYHPWCTYSTPPSPSAPKAFCISTCHPYCDNHYSAFQTIPHQRLPPNYASSHLLATAGVPPNTPIFEISSKLHTHPSPTTFELTTKHHSDALTNHPLLQLMHSTNTPNCHLEAILIPEPAPHLKLFVVSSTTILPYTPLRIRPPPEPPPQKLLVPATKGNRSTSNNPSLITSYFKRSST